MRTTSRILAALAGAAALAAMPAAAGAAPGWTGANPIPESPAAPYPVVGLDADGTATAIWQQAVNPTAILVATKQPGGAWSRADDLPGGQSQGRPALAVAADGSAVAAWWDNVTSEIEVAARDAEGTWSAVEPISAGGATPTSTPSVAFDRGGNVTVAWGEACQVVTSSRAARSSRWTEPLAVFAVPGPCEGITNAEVKTPPALGFDRVGNTTVVWRTDPIFALPVTGMGVKSSVRTNGLRGGWSVPKQLAESSGGEFVSSEPDLAVDVDGRAVVAWPVADGGASVATRPAGVDEAWSAPQALVSTRTSHPSVALDAHGRASVAWDAAQNGPTPGAVRLSTVSPADVWSGPETVATLPDGSEPAFSPELTLDDDGGATVAWSRAGATGAAIEAARRPAGGAWSALQPLAADAPQTGTIVGIAGDPLGNATVVWPVGPTAGDPSQTSSVTGLASADFNAEPALTAEWSGRTERTTNSLWSWVTYLYNGGGGVELSDGATWPYVEDRYSWRWGQQDAWRDTGSGELVIEQQGTLRFSYPDHFIDIQLVNPTLRVAADGRAARLISDGVASGSMADARAGRGTLTPFDDLHVLDIDLDAGGYRAGAAVGRRSWIGAPATMTQIADQTLGNLGYAGTPFGRLTFSAPVTVPDRDPPRPPPIDPPRPPVETPGPPVTDPPRPPVQQPRPPAARGPALRSADSAKVNRSGIAKVATITCREGTCRVQVPRSVRVRLGRRRFVLAVRGPRALSAGKTGAITVRLSRRARRALAGRRVTVRFGYSVTSATGTLRNTVRATLKVPRATAGRRRGARRR